VRLSRLLQNVMTEVAAAVRDGLSVEATQKKVKLADAKAKFCAAGAFQSWCENGFENNFVLPAVARSYMEQKARAPQVRGLTSMSFAMRQQRSAPKQAYQNVWATTSMPRCVPSVRNLPRRTR